jgi:hypothetical protein
MAAEVSIDDLNGLPLLAVRDVALRGWRLTIKRGMDLIFSTIMLVLTSTPPASPRATGPTCCRKARPGRGRR